MEKSLNRIESVDVFRWLAILAVIALHTHPFGSKNGGSDDVFSLAIQINQCAKFAVPFFFIISGYFWGKKISDGAPIMDLSLERVKKIAFLFLVWSIIYIFPFNVAGTFNHGLLGPIKGIYWNLGHLAQRPFDLFFQGTKIHLWFLVALLYCISISASLIARNRLHALIACSVILYLFGLSARAYAHTPVGISIDFDTRNGPFFGLIFFVSGYVLSKMSPTPDWFWKGGLLALSGYVLQVSELYFLHKYFGASPLQDYLIGTYFFGLGVGLIALSNRTFLKIPMLGEWGHLTFGIYAIHFVFLEALYPIELMTCSPFWEIGYVLAILILLMISVKWLSKSKTMKRMVI